MTNASASSVPHTNTTLPTTLLQSQRYNTDDEAVFLAQQAADAKIAMQRTIAEIKVSATAAADVRWWTQQYPWYAVGAAAIVGFIGIGKVLAPAPPPQPVVTAPAASSSWLTPLFEMLRTTIMSAIIGAVHASGEKTGVQEQAVADGQTQASRPFDPDRRF